MSIKSKVKGFIENLIRKQYKYFCRFIKVDPQMIFFCSFSGKGYLCNPKYIHKYMSKNVKYNEFNFVWAFKNININIENAKNVKYNSIKYFYCLAKSKYWIVNYRLPGFLKKKNSQIYFQTWHGTPLKKLGHDIDIGEGSKFYRTQVSKAEMTKLYDTDSQKYDYLLSQNSYSTNIFKSAFNVSEKKIIEEGYPRVDYLLNATKGEQESIKNRYKIPMNKKIILYAPTYRDKDFNSRGYLFQLSINFQEWREKLEDKYVVIFKPHYLIINNYSKLKNTGDFLYVASSNRDIQDLFIISDMLITDYSSVLFDYSILKRPVLFYMYDFENYNKNVRGFYIDIKNKFDKYIATDQEELLDLIKNIDQYREELVQRITEFSQEFNSLQNGHVTERILKKIII